MNRYMTFTASALAVCTGAFGVELAVGDRATVDYAEPVVLSVQTESVGASIPDSLARPVFWLDSSDVSAWTVSENGQVSCVVSKEGSRTLTGDLREGHFKGWPANDNSDAALVLPSKPVLIADPAGLFPFKVLDFGARASRRALVFDANGSSSNLLTNIGTVIAVINPTAGAYFPLGGGFGNAALTGDSWLRESDYATTGAGTDALWTSPLLRFAEPAMVPDDAARAVVRHNGQATAADTTGWPGGWEIMSFMPKSANLRATGLGIAREKGYGAGYSGGFMIAEMLIFDRQLPLADVRSVEAYLQKKWFGAAPAGFGGEADVGWVHAGASGATACPVTVNVDEGERLTIERLQGGRLGAALVKNGAGDLALEDVSGFGGEVEINGGSISFSGRPVPTLQDVVGKAYAHFDACDVATLRISEDAEGKERVSAWSNTCDTTLYGQAFGLRSLQDVRRPTLLRNALGANLNILDFNAFQSQSAASMVFSELAAQAPVARVVPCVTTVIGVFGAQDNGGGHLFSSSSVDDGVRAWSRPVNWPGYAHSLLGTSAAIRTNTAYELWPTNSFVLLNGVKAPSNAGYRHSGYQTVSLRMPGANIRELARGELGLQGGLRVGELFVFRRVLTETEMRDVSAYLEAKWFNRTAPGYRNAECRVPRLGKVTVGGSSSIAVASGDEVRIKTLAGSAALVKNGGGTLSVENVGMTGGIDVKEGVLKLTLPDDEEEEPCRIARGASLHFDACDTDTLTIGQDGENEVVTAWRSKSGGGSAYNAVGRSPVWQQNQKGEGLSVLDFGETFGASGKYLAFDTSRDAVRSVFAVWQAKGSSAPLLGSINTVAEAAATALPYDFLRDGNGALFRWFAHTKPFIQSVWVNGEQSEYNYIAQDKGFHLAEVHLSAGFHASALGAERYASQAGGLSIGEVIIYERELTEREKVATRNYLMRKWFGTEPQALPSREVPGCAVGSLEIAGGGSVDLAGSVAPAEASFEVEVLAASAKMTVAGVFTVPTGMSVRLLDADSLPDLDQVDIPLVTATGFANAERSVLGSAVISGLADERRKAALVVSGNTLFVRVSKRKGFCCVIR
jgi:autotransporter-associated beta strand protein